MWDTFSNMDIVNSMCLFYIPMLLHYCSSALQMELSRRFQEASTCYMIKTGSLQNERPYPITLAEWVDMRFGPAVLLSIRDSAFCVKKAFLPRRYGDVVTDEDIAGINSQNVKLYLVYKGVCMQMGGCLLAIKHSMEGDTVE